MRSPRPGDRDAHPPLDLHAVEQTVAQHEEIDLQTVSRVDEIERRVCADRGTSGVHRNIELGVRSLEKRLLRFRPSTLIAMSTSTVDRGSPMRELAIEPPSAYGIPRSSRIAATCPTSSSGPLVIREEEDRRKRRRREQLRTADASSWQISNLGIGGMASMDARAQVARRRGRAVGRVRRVRRCSSCSTARSGSRTPQDRCRPEQLSAPRQANSELRQRRSVRQLGRPTVPS